MQIAKSFDKATLIKIGKGALIAAGAPAGIGLLTYIGGLEVNNMLLASFVAWIVPVGINTIKEWAKGK